MLHIFRTSFPKNNSGRLLPEFESLRARWQISFLILNLHEPTPQMVKHTQTIRRLTADEFFLSVFDHFVGLTFKELRNLSKLASNSTKIWFSDHFRGNIS